MVIPPPAPWKDNCWLHTVKSHLSARETRSFLVERFVCLFQHDVRTFPDKWRVFLHSYRELTEDKGFWQQHSSPLTKSPQLLGTFPPSTQTWNRKFLNLLHPFCTRKTKKYCCDSKAGSINREKPTGYSAFPGATSAGEGAFYWPCSCCVTTVPWRAHEQNNSPQDQGLKMKANFLPAERTRHNCHSSWWRQRCLPWRVKAAHKVFALTLASKDRLK